jgi:hypothetical protein
MMFVSHHSAFKVLNFKYLDLLRALKHEQVYEVRIQQVEGPAS